jgi:ribose 5-phosphate isomerase A
VEITPFCYEHTRRLIESLPSLQGGVPTAVIRRGSSSNNKQDGPDIAVTDNGNFIVDLFFAKPIPDVALVH